MTKKIKIEKKLNKNKLKSWNKKSILFFPE
jgi:hypothetical protein